MTVLDSFYLLFKTDAKGAEADVKALDKQISELAAKGQKRTDTEVKQLKELRKQRTEITRDIKDQTQEVDKLGQSFVKTIESVAAAGTSLFAFGALKAGVKTATEFNSQLQITAKILGQNPKSLSAFANAAELAGGTKEGAISQYKSLFDYYSAHGLKNPTPENLLAALRKDLATRTTPEGKAQLLQQLGISERGVITLGQESQGAFDEHTNKGLRAALSEEQTQKLRDLAQAEAEASQELTHTFGVLGAEIADYIIPSLKSFGEVLHSISNIPGGSTALGAAGVVGGGFLGSKLIGSALRALGLGGSGAALGIGSKLGIAGLIGAGAWTALSAEEALINSYFGKKGASADGGNQSSLEFWMSKGYTRQQAAGIAGNELAESSGNPAARNFSKGTHYGLYQWSESRRAKIKESIGIDVATASAEDQRKAAAWELQDRGDDNRIKATSTSGESAAAFNRYFEISGEDPARRQRLAAMIEGGKLGDVGSLGGSDGGNRTLSVKTGDIIVNTQATDAQGIASGVGSALQSQIRNAVSGWDDGIAQ